MVGGIGFLGSSFTFSETKPFIQIANDQIAKESTLPSSSSYEMKALFCPDVILLSKEEDGNITSLLLFFHGVENIQEEPSHVLRVGRVVTVGLKFKC